MVVIRNSEGQLIITKSQIATIKGDCAAQIRWRCVQRVNGLTSRALKKLPFVLPPLL